MRVLLVTETLTLGGAELFVVRLANALQSKAQVGIVVFYADQVHPSIQAGIAPGVQLILVPVKGIWFRKKIDSVLTRLGISFSFTHTALARALRQIIHEFQPQVVHGNLWKTDWVISDVRQSATFMHVCTAHGDYSESYLSRHSPGVIDVQRKIADTVASVDRIVCLNEGEINFFRKYFPGADAKLSRIVNGYQPPAAAPGSKSRKELGLPDKGFLFGMVGRGVEKKGWKQAIDAFMLAGLPSAYLVLVGGGEYLRELATKVIDDRIIFTGETPAPLKYIAHFDVGLMPTLFEQESLPTVIMEYLYCGKPVIATNVGDIRKMLTDDSTGEMAGALVDREKLLTGGDTLVLLMRKFVEEPAFRKQKESAAPGAFVKFDMEACADAYLRLYGGT